mmetsp:Transcript_3501/g.8323  ORF Transcript_3501/g.8323 Transcript_3501/m.8323 type:complete len:118 (-) Transcript_3501:59-412(-)
MLLSKTPTTSYGVERRQQQHLESCGCDFVMMMQPSLRIGMTMAVVVQPQVEDLFFDDDDDDDGFDDGDDDDDVRTHGLTPVAWRGVVDGYRHPNKPTTPNKSTTSSSKHQKVLFLCV